MKTREHTQSCGKISVVIGQGGMADPGGKDGVITVSITIHRWFSTRLPAWEGMEFSLCPTPHVPPKTLTYMNECI